MANPVLEAFSAYFNTPLFQKDPEPVEKTTAAAPPAEQGTLRLLVWNIQSPAFALNPLEFLPGKGMLTKATQATLNQALQSAVAVLLTAETSPTLETLLGDAPMRLATDIETAPITAVPAKLGEWMESRKANWEDIWPGLSSEEAANKFCAEYTARWDFWKRQTVFAWLCDDGSGGKSNSRVPATKPQIDELAWTLGVSSADRAYGDKPGRVARARWMRSTTRGAEVAAEPGKTPDKIGKVDFLKLLVWDLVLNAVVAEIPEAEYDALLDGLSPLPTEKRMAEVAARVKDYDVSILMEVPEAGLAGLEDFHVVKSAAKDAVMNTVVFARKSLYEEPVARDFIIEGLDPQPRVVECTLKSERGELHILGVHLSGKGYEGAQVAPALNERIKPNTVLAGDFNVDLRKGEGKWTDLSAFPQLRALVGQATQLPEDQGSTNKERSCFQAQVSKMFMQDFSMKDFLFVGEGLVTTPVEGLVPRSQLLPDISCPSDHCPLTTVIRGL